MSLDEQVDELAKLATREHFWNDDDGWYTCPAHEEGQLASERYGSRKCQCGADEHNAKVAVLAAEIKARIKANENVL